MPVWLRLRAGKTSASPLLFLSLALSHCFAVMLDLVLAPLGLVMSESLWSSALCNLGSILLCRCCVVPLLLVLCSLAQFAAEFVIYSPVLNLGVQFN